VTPTLPLVGEDFAGYRLRAVIGRGGMSVVYEAENLRLGSTIALKVLAPELSADDTFRARFLKESRIAASLNHPHVIPIYDTGPSGELLFIAMRYVAGSDLRSVLRKSTRVLPEQALLLIGQTGRALDAAHRQGLVHRDVKPANVLVERGADDDPDHVYLADFGITKHALSRSGLTATGQFVGTVDYISPEQIQDRPVDGRTDIYSLGCVMYECLTGRVPFVKELDAAVIWAHVEELPTPPSAVDPNLPAAIDGVIARALAKDPDERFSTCREFLVAATAALGPVVEAPGERRSDVAFSSGPPSVLSARPPGMPPAGSQRTETIHGFGEAEGDSFATRAPLAGEPGAGAASGTPVQPPEAPGAGTPVQPPAGAGAAPPAQPPAHESMAAASALPVGDAAAGAAPPAQPPADAPSAPSQSPGPSGAAPSHPSTPAPTGAGPQPPGAPTPGGSGGGSRRGLIAAGVAVLVAAVVVLALVLAGGGSKKPAVVGELRLAALAPVPLNRVHGSGTTELRLDGDRATITLDAQGLLNGSSHLMHIHAGGLGSCPPASAAHVHGGHLTISTTDGIPWYGPPEASLTTSGDTSAASYLVFSRFPRSGTISYHRTITVSSSLARKIRANKAVVVIHGIDYDGRGIYDNVLSHSELEPTVPAEATAPALCGALVARPSDAASSAQVYVASLSAQSAAAALWCEPPPPGAESRARARSRVSATA
jgi:serine/threonine protein kinase